MNPITAQPLRPLARGSLRLQSDDRLVKLFQRGVEPAFDELVRRHRDALVRYAGAIAGANRAEDVVQESLVKAHRSLSGDRQIEPKPWLYKIVRNTALNDIRDNRKHEHDDLGDSASRTQAPQDVLEQRERLASVVAAVSGLPPSQRRALIGHELGGFSHEEIAAELDLTTGATKQLIYRARLTLRNAAGALIPTPLIAWLASDGAGLLAAGASTGAAAGAAKLAVVAVVAGGSFTAGVAIEKKQSAKPVVTTQASDPKTITGTAGEPEGLPPVGPTSVLTADNQKSDDRSDRDSKRGEKDGQGRGDESENRGPGKSGARPGAHGGQDRESDDQEPYRPDSGRDDSDDDDHPRPAGFDDDGDDDSGDDDQYRPSRPANDDAVEYDDPYENDSSDSDPGSESDDSNGNSPPPPVSKPIPKSGPSRRLR